jgi:hypothetical protein
MMDLDEVGIACASHGAVHGRRMNTPFQISFLEPTKKG